MLHIFINTKICICLFNYDAIKAGQSNMGPLLRPYQRLSEEEEEEE